MKWLVALALPTRTLAIDPCMKHLARQILPQCVHPCYDECCAALAYDETGCSKAWVEETRLWAQRQRDKMAGECNCTSALRPCLFTRTEGSPCLAPECWTMHATGTVTDECATVIDAHCTLVSTDAGCAVPRRCEGTDWHSCAFAERASLVDDALAQYAMIPSHVARTTVTKEGYEWVSERGCTNQATLAPKTCPCVKHRRVGEILEVLACVSSESLWISLSAGATSSFQAIFVAVLTASLALAFWCAEVFLL